MNAAKRSAGFTLIELMVASGVMLLVAVYTTQIFAVQNMSYIVTEQVSEAQQNLRAGSDLLARDVRRAGYLVPPHAAVCGWDQVAQPDTLFVSNADVLASIFELETAGASLTQSFGAPVTGVNAAWTASGSAFALSLSRLWVDLAANGADFATGAGVIVANRAAEDGLVACGIIQAIAGTTLTVDFGSTTMGPVGLNADVVAVPALVYQVTGNPPQLWRNGSLLASGVEDLQVSWFFDLDDDRVVDLGELFGASGVTPQPWELTPATGRPDFSSLREVGLNLVTVTRDDDPNPDFGEGAGQVTGNRTAASLPSGDGKRRRVSSARVRMRNAG